METKQSIAFKLQQDSLPKLQVSGGIAGWGAPLSTSQIAPLATMGTATLSTAQTANLSTTQLTQLVSNMDLVISALKKIGVAP